ncbi:MAG TPA: hypothetical protein VH988_19710 [Thermoanaerobaculia bacterium]|jgi:predicted outer membrane repeat protein|nr:hypothetical protein [Thermoanaerobaculia bacterium]
MIAQPPAVRRLLSLVLACSLLAVLLVAAQALAADPKGPSQPGQAKPNPKEGPPGCGILSVFLKGSSLPKVANVACDKGANDGTQRTPEGVVLTLHQTDGRGPQCVITVGGGKDTAVLSVQQNLCALKGGAIKASVVSGNATLTRTVRGGFPSTPGEVYFSIGF